MNAKLVGVGMAMVVVGILILALTPPTQSTICAQSVIQIRPQVTVCPPSQSYVDSALFASSPSSNSGVWGSNSFTVPGQITNTNGVMKVYYFLSSGASLSSKSLKFNYGIGAFSAVTAGLTSGTDGYGSWFGTSSVSSVLSSPGQTAQFRASILDSSGLNSSITFSFQLLAASATVTFMGLDVSNPNLSGSGGAPLPGVVVQVYSSGSQLAGTYTTGGTGSVQAQLAPGTYTAIAYGPAGYVTGATAPFCKNQWVNASSSVFSVGQNGPTVSFSFAKGSQSQCNATVTVTTPPPPVITPPTITTSQTITLPPTTCSIPPGQTAYTCTGTPTVTGTGSGGGQGGAIFLGFLFVGAGIVVVASGLRKRR